MASDDERVMRDAMTISWREVNKSPPPLCSNPWKPPPKNFKKSSSALKKKKKRNRYNDRFEILIEILLWAIIIEMTRWTQRESVTLFTERSVRWVKRDRGVRMTRWLIDRSIPFSSVLMSVTVVVWWWLQEKTSETSQWSAVMGRGQANRWQFYSRTHKEGQKCVSVDGLFVNCEWSQGRCVESRQRWSANWSVKGWNDDPLVDGGVNVTLYHGVNRSFWVNDGFWWLMASSRGNWMNEALNRWWSNNFFFFFSMGRDERVGRQRERLSWM